MSNYYVTNGVVNSGTIVMSCDGSCDYPTFEHRFMFYTLEEAQDIYRREHSAPECYCPDWWDTSSGDHNGDVCSL